jgi:hypothetical protein
MLNKIEFKKALSLQMEYNMLEEAHAFTAIVLAPPPPLPP